MSRTNLIVKYAYPEKPEVASRYTLSNLWHQTPFRKEVIKSSAVFEYS
jgi:hypothetical protein